MALKSRQKMGIDGKCKPFSNRRFELPMQGVRWMERERCGNPAVMRGCEDWEPSQVQLPRRKDWWQGDRRML